MVETDLLMPNGVRVNPDESLVLVADTLARTAWSYHIEPDGSLSDGEPFYHLEFPDDVARRAAAQRRDGITFDSIGRLYMATKMGIQVSDQPGRVNGIIRTPGKADPSNLVLAGRT